MAVAAVAVTYCAVVSIIAERAILRTICWIGALVYSCYVWALIWFEFDVIPGRILALLAVLQSACSLLAVIDFIAATTRREKVLVLLIYLLSIAPIADLLIYLSLWAKRNALRVVKVSDFGVS